jgi:hypothetical protein
MYIFIIQPVFEYGLYSLGLGCFLGRQPAAIEHIKEIGIATGV